MNYLPSNCVLKNNLLKHCIALWPFLISIYLEIVDICRYLVTHSLSRGRVCVSAGQGVQVQRSKFSSWYTVSLERYHFYKHNSYSIQPPLGLSAYIDHRLPANGRWMIGAFTHLMTLFTHLNMKMRVTLIAYKKVWSPPALAPPQLQVTGWKFAK